MRALGLVLAALLALGPLGCTHRAPVPVTASPEKPATGTVALVMSDTAPVGHFQQPGVVGGDHGAKQGAKTGARVPIVPGLVVVAGAASGGDGRGVIAGLMLLGAGVVLAPVGAAVGAAMGALAAPSKEEAKQSAAALERALADTRLADALVVRVLEAGGSRLIIAPAVVHPDTAMPAVDTFLELEVPRVSLGSKDPTDWKPRLRLRLAVGARLVRASDGEELRRWWWEHEGREARLVEWGKDDARLFREELERAIQAVALQAISDLF